MTTKKTPAKKADPTPSRQKAAQAPSSTPRPSSPGLGIKDKFTPPGDGK